MNGTKQSALKLWPQRSLTSVAWPRKRSNKPPCDVLHRAVTSEGQLRWLLGWAHPTGLSCHTLTKKKETSMVVARIYKLYKKFWEELLPYFPLIRHEPHRKTGMDRHQGDIISIILFFQKDESRLTMAMTLPVATVKSTIIWDVPQSDIISQTFRGSVPP
jgi:hypothetical protein